MPCRPRPTYAQLASVLPDCEDHPVDQHVTRFLPQEDLARRVRQHQRELLDVAEEHPEARRALIDLEDVWMRRAAERERSYFDLGVELGLVQGRAEALQELAGAVSVSATGQQLAHQVHLLATTSTVDPTEATCVLVAAAYGVLGLVDQAEGQDEPLDVLQRLVRALVELLGRRPGQGDGDEEGQS